MKNLRIVLLAALFMAVLVMAWWFVLSPNDEADRIAQAEIADKQAKLRELNLAKGMVGSLESEIRSYENANDWFQSKLPKEREIDRVLKEIWVLARQNDLAPKSVRPAERNRGATIQTVTLPDFCIDQPIALELEGDFMGLYKFLQAVETQPRIVRVTQLEVTRDNNKLPGQLRAALTMSIYFEKASETAPATRIRGV
jgi:Tfp pilus assembly protein PilO